MSLPDFLRKLRRQPVGEWLWMGEALLLLAWARLLIRFVPFRAWGGAFRSMQSEVPPVPGNDRDRALAKRTGLCVRRVARNAPFRAICLPKAMAARWMLARRGIATELCIGAKPGDAEIKPFGLHAWLMYDDLCLVGAAERAKFTPFRSPKSRAFKSVSAEPKQ